jgi:uncharacterized lipoprotein YehR (DUF1307 family)
MEKMKRFFASIMMLSVLCVCFAGCGDKTKSTKKDSVSDKGGSTSTTQTTETTKTGDKK